VLLAGVPGRVEFGLFVRDEFWDRVRAAVIRLRTAGEILPIRGYVADMGSWPTHKAALIRLYLEG
jgi:Protein of unknown function (DUF1670)